MYTAAAIIIAACIGFLLGCQTSRELAKETDDGHLLDEMDRLQFDLDVFSNRNTDFPDWTTYHPGNHGDYNSKKFDNVRDAIRHYLQNHA